MPQSMAMLAKGKQIIQLVIAALAQGDAVMDFQTALSSLAILASVAVPAKGCFANLAPLRTPGSPAASLRAETVLHVARYKHVGAIAVAALNHLGLFGVCCRCSHLAYLLL